VANSRAHERVKAAVADAIRPWDLLDSDVGAGETPIPLSDSALSDLADDITRAVLPVVTELVEDALS